VTPVPDDWKDDPLYVPAEPAQIATDPAEIIALRTLVQALIAVLATQTSTDREAQLFLNSFSAECQKALLSTNLIAPDGRDLETVRQRAIDHVNDMIGGIRFNKIPSRSI
jgi:hypothetical protein